MMHSREMYLVLAYGETPMPEIELVFTLDEAFNAVARMVYGDPSPSELLEARADFSDFDERVRDGFEWHVEFEIGGIHAWKVCVPDDLVSTLAAQRPVCDCEDPEPANGVALVSNECPVHNLNPRPAPQDGDTANASGDGLTDEQILALADLHGLRNASKQLQFGRALLAAHKPVSVDAQAPVAPEFAGYLYTIENEARPHDPIVRFRREKLSEAQLADPNMKVIEVRELNFAAPIASALPATIEGQWISVDDRLPEEKQTVIVFRPDAHYLPACDPNIDCRCYFGNGMFNGIHKVTHWMPIPVAPALPAPQPKEQS